MKFMLNQEKILHLISLYKICSPDFWPTYHSVVDKFTPEDFKQLAFLMIGELHFSVFEAEMEISAKESKRFAALAA
jgi:hypothetical protein